ncbi:hypothetical protein LTR08_006395 [Meristemomyces frigidus]|nr:hypothetical protein LTR08_006395 [Meristemomyces frigidus]
MVTMVLRDTNAAAASSKKKLLPQKLLLADELSEKQCAVYDAIATESPLLCLPPEVRNRIWLYTLAGRTIHVRFHKASDESFKRTICRLHATPEEEARERKRGTTPQQSPYYRAAHGGCTERVSLSLLQVCRQIHQEAALLHYQENDFTFASFAHLSDFLRSLIPAQAKAIESIAVSDDGSYRNMHDSALYDKLLPNLKKLIVFVAFGVITGDDVAYSRTCIAQRVGQFRHLPITTAVVTSYVYYDLGGRGVVESITQAMDLWTAELQEKLVRRYDRNFEDAVEKRRKEEEVTRKELAGLRAMRGTGRGSRWGRVRDCAR